MERTGRLPWVTPAKYVGPAMVVLLLAGGAVAGVMLAAGRSETAIAVLLFAIGFLILGLADLLGELIMLGREGRAGR